jgi:hypothetical protein
MFGGAKNYANISSVIKLSNFKGKIYSLCMDFPDYCTLLKDRVYKTNWYSPEWNSVNWENLTNIFINSETIDPNQLKPTNLLCIGDSHAISMYRPGWNVTSVPYKTLYGAIKHGFEHFIPSYITDIKTLEIYFGNIDIRHHLMRMDDPVISVRELVKSYIQECKKIHDKYSCNIVIYELLPIESEIRKLPKTGYYKGTPFFGTRIDRDNIRKLFKDELLSYDIEYISMFEWVNKLTNDFGELDFEYMEKPKSVHLSRYYYPHWNGLYDDNIEQFTQISDQPT